MATRMGKLETRFRAIHGTIMSELDSKKIPVRRILNSLTSLPIELRREYQRSISEKVPELRREEKASDLFIYHLNPLVNFIDYHLIKYIIEEFGSNTLKVDVNSYSNDMVLFMKKTTVKELMEHCRWPGMQSESKGLARLVTKIDGNEEQYTLYDLDELRRRFCAGIKLTEIVFVLIGLETSTSFLAMWVVPSLLVPQLMEASKSLDFGFYLRLRILKVTVGDQQIFPFLPASKSKVPALQAEAATVTVSCCTHSVLKAGKGEREWLERWVNFKEKVQAYKYIMPTLICFSSAKFVKYIQGTGDFDV